MGLPEEQGSKGVDRLAGDGRGSIVFATCQ